MLQQEKRKRIVVPFLCTLTFIVGIGSYAYASNNYLIKSKGIIQVDGNDDTTMDILFDANDLKTIENNIVNGKSTIASAINSYPNKNISADATFDDIGNAINSLTSFAENTYFYAKGTEGDEATIERYKKIDEEYFSCNANGIITDNTPVDITSKELIEYDLMTQNIDVGSAGYINKTLWLGNGYFNKSSYAQGYIDGQKDAAGNLNIQYTYHSHKDGSGNETDEEYLQEAGGCYTDKQPFYETVSIYISRSEYMAHVQSYGAFGNCSHCGGEVSVKGPAYGDPAGHYGTHTHVKAYYYYVGCGKTTETIESATIIY